MSKPMNFFTPHFCAAWQNFRFEKRIEHGAKRAAQRAIWCTIRPVEPESSGMRSLFRAIWIVLVGNEPVLPRQRESRPQVADQRAMCFCPGKERECERSISTRPVLE